MLTTKVIRIDEQVWATLQAIATKHNKPFTSPNNVLRLLLYGDVIPEGKRNNRV